MLLKFMSLPMLEEDDGLNIGGTGEEEQEVAEPVNELHNNRNQPHLN